MRYTLIFTCLVCFFLPNTNCFAVEYHVSVNARPGGDGSSYKPFTNIQSAADRMLPGDVCIIHEGSYMETIAPANSGLPGEEIVFRVAPNERVTISGADRIERGKWKQTSPNIYRTGVEMTLDHENQVFFDGKMLLEARWPNSSDDLLDPSLSTMDPGTNPELIVDHQLPDLDWADANVWIHAPKYWSNWTTRILTHKRAAITIENLAPYPGVNQHVAAEGSEYFIYGSLSALDTTNEWYYDSREEYLYIYRIDGEPDQKLQVKKRMYAFDLTGKSNITIQGFRFFSASVKTDSATSNIQLEQLKFLYPYLSSHANQYFGDQTDKGIVINGKNITIANSEIAFSSGCGIVLDGLENKVINCYIHDTDYIGTYASSIQLKGKGNIISHCTLTRSGRAVIDYRGMYQSLIQYCDFSEGGMLTSDTGLTYGNIIEGGNSEVRYNFIHDNKDTHLAMGLYYDHGTQNILSHHNVIWGIDDFGLLINHYSYFHEVYNNTFSGGRIGFRSRWGNKYEPDLYGCRFFNNVFNNPAETDAGNYAWGYNLENYKDLTAKQQLPNGSPAIDAGIILPGINDHFTGEAPDLGAFEKGIEWRPGHNSQEPPTPNLDRKITRFQNRIGNSAFEHEDHLFPWDTIGSVELVNGFKNQTSLDTARLRMGRWSVSLDSDGEIYQVVTGLEPGSWYDFTGFLRVESGERAFLGVKNKEGSEWHSPTMTGNSPHWKRCVLSFKTEEEQTSAIVFVRKTNEGDGKAYLDDFGLKYVRKDDSGEDRNLIRK